jgi:hypothetical protein
MKPVLFSARIDHPGEIHMSLTNRTFYGLLAASFLFVLRGGAIAADPAVKIESNADAGTTTVSIDGEQAFVYQHGEVDLPHFHPLNSPFGQNMLVRQTNPYPHHRALWFADTVQLKGERKVSFYNAYYTGEGQHRQHKAPFNDRIRQVSLATSKQAEDAANVQRYTEQLAWEMDGDTPVLDEERDVRIVALGDGEYFLDMKFTVTASYDDVDVVSDDVHYAWPYLRMNKTFSVEGGNGTIVNSAGGVNQAGTHNQQATWVDYSATVDGETSGLAVFSSADNKHPHRWLTRDYGTFGPRRINELSGKKFTLAKGESLTTRVGILVHRGDAKDGKVAERYKAYCDGEL